LRGIANRFNRLGVNWIDVRPHVLDRNPGHFVEVTLVGRNTAWLWQRYSSGFIKLLHILALISPEPLYAEKLVTRVSFCSASRCREIIPSEATTSSGFDVVVVRLNIFLVIWGVLHIPKCTCRIWCTRR